MHLNPHPNLLLKQEQIMNFMKENQNLEISNFIITIKHVIKIEFVLQNLRRHKKMLVEDSNLGSKCKTIFFILTLINQHKKKNNLSVRKIINGSPLKMFASAFPS